MQCSSKGGQARHDIQRRLPDDHGVSRATDTANTGCAKCGDDEARRGCGFLLAAPGFAAARKRDADS
jgi:hypothetical protein